MYIPRKDSKISLVLVKLSKQYSMHCQKASRFRVEAGRKESD